MPEGAVTIWKPFPGFQERALAAGADEVFLGGAKGPGKTDVLLAAVLRQAHKPMMAEGFVRRSFPELQRPLDRAHAIYGRLPSSQRPAWNGKDHRFTFPSGAFLQFGHTQDLTWTQGGNWSGFKYDEMANEEDEGKVNTLVSEIRCPDPTVRRSLMGSGNPGFAGHPWIQKRYIKPCGKDGAKIAWRRDVLPDGRVGWRSRQFVPGRVTDNPIYLNDVAYMTALHQLPERMRRCLLDGDWDAATGVALDELDEAVHIRPAFTIPKHWPYVAGFDWGFVHNCVYCHGRVSDDGRIYVVDTVKRRLMQDWDLAGAFEELIPLGARTNVQSGGDIKNEVKAREDQRSTRDTFAKKGIHLVVGSSGRVFDYRNMLAYLSHRPSEYVPARDPGVVFFDTPGNQWLFEQLGQMVLDPDDPRDVLKVNANVETGEGGDDGYDAFRKMLAARPRVAKSGFDEVIVDAFDPIILRAEADRAGKALGRPRSRRRRKYF